MSTTNLQMEYFEIERKRRKYALEADYQSLIDSYKSSITLPNKNTGNFWDQKFSSDSEKVIQNEMEKDRNMTARRIYLRIAKKNSTSINIGCGDGNFEREIAKAMDVKHFGVDLATKTILFLRNKYPHFCFDTGNIVTNQSTLFEKKYDIACMFEVLEHIEPQKSLHTLQNIKRLIRNNGYLLISVPMNEGLEQMYPYNPNEHLRCYSPELLFAELKISGFSVKEYYFFYAFETHYWLKKMLAATILKSRWKPNNILVLAQKN